MFSKYCWVGPNILIFSHATSSPTLPLFPSSASSIFFQVFPSLTPKLYIQLRKWCSTFKPITPLLFSLEICTLHALFEIFLSFGLIKAYKNNQREIYEIIIALLERKRQLKIIMLSSIWFFIQPTYRLLLLNFLELKLN